MQTTIQMIVLDSFSIFLLSKLNNKCETPKNSVHYWHIPFIRILYE